jgi:branched-subunit amino acid aminotransferase/4-amino-4-deoxychorismate lyase
MTPVNALSYIWHNGKIEKSETGHLDIVKKTRANITVSETMVTRGTEIMFFAETLKRLNFLAKIYRITPTLLKGNDGEQLKSEVKRTLIRNKCYQTAQCHIVFQYLPNEQQTKEFLFIEPDPLLFSQDKTVSNVCFTNNFSKPDGFCMKLPSVEHEYRKMLQLEMHENNAGDCIILNQHQEVVETFLGNLFLVKNNTITTPSPASGCTQRVMRPFVMERLALLGYPVNGKDNLSRHDVLNSSELFTAGTSGIFFIKGIGNKRYFDKVRKELLQSMEEGF